MYNLANKKQMRLEDTVLITDDGASNLPESVPVELSDIYKLMKQKGSTENWNRLTANNQIEIGAEIKSTIL